MNKASREIAVARKLVGIVIEWLDRAEETLQRPPSNRGKGADRQSNSRAVQRDGEHHIEDATEET